MPDVADGADTLGAVTRGIAAELPAAVAGRAIAERLSTSARSPTPAGGAACAQWLLRFGYVAEAETIYEALSRIHPTMPAGFAGLAQTATQRREWTEALRRWDEVLAAFPAQRNAYWHSARALVLFELSRAEEAAAILEALITAYPEQAHGRIGLAQMAMRRQRWGEALQRWDEVLERHPRHEGLAFAQLARANALSLLGRHAEAEPILRALIQADPWIVDAYSVLMRVLAATGRLAQAAQVLADSLFADAAVPALCRPQLEILLRGRRLDAARAQFPRYLASVVDLESWGALLTAAPMLFERWHRTQIWLEMLRRLDDCQRRAGPEGLRGCRLLRARVKLALRDQPGFLEEARAIDAPESLGESGRSVRAVAAALADPRFPDHGKPKVFGIGLSKTGTNSVAAALTLLGLNTLHWSNPLTGEVIGEDDLYLFDAFTDLPACTAFEKNYYQFPAAKFIYTIRPYEAWIGSLLRHGESMLNIDQFGEFRRQSKDSDTFRYGREFCNIQQTIYLNYPDLRRAFDAYDRRVRGFFRDKPKDRFLSFSVFDGDGWPELCSFLGMPVPPVPFPFENRSSTTPAGRTAR